MPLTMSCSHPLVQRRNSIVASRIVYGLDRLQQDNTDLFDLVLGATVDRLASKPRAGITSFDTKQYPLRIEVPSDCSEDMGDVDEQEMNHHQQQRMSYNQHHHHQQQSSTSQANKHYYHHHRHNQHYRTDPRSCQQNGMSHHSSHQHNYHTPRDAGDNGCDDGDDVDRIREEKIDPAGMSPLQLGESCTNSVHATRSKQRRSRRKSVFKALTISLACVTAVVFLPICLAVHVCVESPDADDKPSVVHRIWPCLPMEHEKSSSSPPPSLSAT